MTERRGNAVFIYEEEPQLCEFCGQIRETRPYGKDGKEICFECSEKPENREEAEKNMRKLIGG